MIYRVEENNVAEFMNVHRFKTATVNKDGKYWIIDGTPCDEEMLDNENTLASDKKHNEVND